VSRPFTAFLVPTHSFGRIEHGFHSQEMVREPVVGNAYVSATRWNRVSAVSGPVLRSTPGGPHLPSNSLPLPCGERKGAGGSGSERTLAPPHAIVARERTGERGDGSASILATSYAMVARARYVPDETFLIRLYAPIRKIPIRRSPHPISTSLARRGSLIHCFSLNLI
jgi:hypothetical protein